MENAFLGKVRIEILSIDGRQIARFEREKTAVRQLINVSELINDSEVSNLAVVPNVFLVRVSDGKSSATRLVLKF